MGIIQNDQLVAGTVVKYLGTDERGNYAMDVTVGREYTIVALDDDGEPYFHDDKGDRNWSAGEKGNGSFELVSFPTAVAAEEAEDFSEWWVGVREWVTLLSKSERENLSKVIAECDEALSQVAKRKK